MTAGGDFCGDKASSVGWWKKYPPPSRYVCSASLYQKKDEEKKRRMSYLVKTGGNSNHRCKAVMYKKNKENRIELDVPTKALPRGQTHPRTGETGVYRHQSDKTRGTNFCLLRQTITVQTCGSEAQNGVQQNLNFAGRAALHMLRRDHLVEVSPASKVPRFYCPHPSSLEHARLYEGRGSP